MRHLLEILRSVSLAFIFAAGAGCASYPGFIEEGLPKLEKRIPADTRFCLARPLGANGYPLFARNGDTVISAFRHAFSRRGIGLVVPTDACRTAADALRTARAADCDVVLFVNVKSWQYNDAGWSGIGGGRDDVLLGVLVMEVRSERVLTRADVRVYNGFGFSPAGGAKNAEESFAPIVDKYVDSLLPPPAD